MNKFRRMGRLIAATTTTAVAMSLVPVAGAQENTVEFSVTNITDFHGNLSTELEDEAGNLVAQADAGDRMGAAYLASLIEFVNQDQEYVMTTSGDNVGGSAFVSAISDDKYTLDFLNAINVEASATGNHEFDKGIDDLLGRIQDGSDYPILGANVYRDGVRALPSHHIVELEGVRVAFVGTVTQQTAAKVSPAGIAGVEFTDPVAETNEVAQELKDKDEADIVISLFHEDADAFKEQFDTDYVDAVFGGDTHLVHQGEDPVVYAQSGDYGRYLTDLDITYNTTTDEIVDIEINQYDATDVVEQQLTANQEVAEIVAEAEAQADVLGAEIVAEINDTFTRGSNPGDRPGSNRGVESTLNHMIAEASRASMEAFIDEPVDLGFMNAGGVRADLPAGNVTYADAFAVQPFGNEVAYGTLTGADILQALEEQWKGPEEGRPRLALGTSDNFAYTYDPEAPQGERIILATIDGEPLDPGTEYTVAMSTFLFEGGDGFAGFKNVKDQVNVGYMDVQVLIDYLEVNPDVTPRADQSAVGVHVEGELEPGNTVTVDLSSLNYSTEGEPMATEVTVELGSASATAEIDNSTVEGDDGYGEIGRASVELTIPEGLRGTQNLIITTDAGTEAVASIELSDIEEGSSIGSSEGGIFAGILAAVAGLAGLLGFAQFFVPNVDIQAEINRFLGR